MKILFATTAIIVLTTSSVFASECGAGRHEITKLDITAAQQAWGDGIVNIGKVEDHQKAAMELTPVE